MVESIQMESMADENEHLLLTGMENALSFNRVFQKHKSMTEFLCQHEYISIRSTSISSFEYENDLDISTDIDGVTIEWKNLAGTSQSFHHLFLGSRLKNVYTLLKKHEDLTKYNAVSLKTFKECVGVPILNDGGWEYVLCLLPEYKCNTPYYKEVINLTTLNWITEIRVKLQEMFREAIPGRVIKETIDKNNVFDLLQIFILPGDRDTVLQMFQSCVDTVVVPQDFRKFLFSYRFGEKDRGHVNLPITDNDAVNMICVHVGVNIQLQDESESLYWSRSGIEPLIGQRGTLSTACGLTECANFQSNLDGRSLQVSGRLRQISKYPTNVRFVQLYADIPHQYPKTRYHPVSAAIIITDGMKSATDSLLKEALEYLSVIRGNFLKLTRSVCRLEIVSSLPEVTSSLKGHEMLNIGAIKSVISEHALFVPFGTSHFMESLQAIGLNICDDLKTSLDLFKRTSAAECVWQSYQYELALEKLIWGHPLSYLSRQHAINLGPGVEYPTRCASDQFGFLKLENKFMCCEDEHSTPPLEIYSGSVVVRHQLQKMFGLWDRTDGTDFILGRCIIQVLLHDFFDIGSVFCRPGEYIASLKESGGSKRIVGAISKSQISKHLISVNKCKFPMFFLHAVRIIKRRNKDVENLLVKGLEEMHLRYFPAFRNYDQQRHQCLYWHFTYGFWAISDLHSGTEIQSDLLCALVVTELENRQLCFTRSLNGTNECFPWVRECIRKLQELNLEENQLVMVLTFVTCVAFLEKGTFVKFDKLRVLLEQLPLTQRQLRSLEIQSQFLVHNMNAFMVWRLHQSIPRHTPKSVTASNSERKDKYTVKT